jgi:YbbR domain-containing protein
VNSFLLWIRRNIGSFLLSCVLALTVWIVAVNAEDPVETRLFPGGVPIVYEGLPEGLVIAGTTPQTGEVTLRAPRSIWEELSAEDIYLSVDLSLLEAGEHTLEVSAVILRQPARATATDPAEVTLVLEQRLSVNVEVQISVNGEPAIGFEASQPQVLPQEAMVSGPASFVNRVVKLMASVDVSGRRDNLDTLVDLLPIDSDGHRVSGVEVAPAKTHVIVPILQLGGYRSLAVIPIIEGQVEPGYRVTNITVSPTLVTIRSTDPQALDLLPGFVQTEPISLTGAKENITQRVLLDLPEGLSVVGDQTVLVQITIAAIESSITITRDLELQNLQPGLEATCSPQSVSVILAGPLPVLDQLRPEDVRVVVNLFELGPGTYQITPEILILPTDVEVQTILPETVEVTIIETGQPTPGP